MNPQTVLDWQEAVDRLGGSEDALRDVVEVFLDVVPDVDDRLRAAVQARDAPTVRDLAHSLKGSCASVGGASVAERARRLEKMGESGDLTRAAEAYVEMEEGLCRLEEELRRHLRGGS